MNGKVLRMNSDASTPDDQAGGNPLYSYAYRSPRGLDWHPTTHTLWVADHSASDIGRLDLIDSTGGAANGVNVPPIDTFTNSRPNVA